MALIPGIVAIASGALLLQSMTLDWYHVSTGSQATEYALSPTAFEVFSQGDFLLVAAAVLGVAAGVALIAARVTHLNGLLKPASWVLRIAGIAAVAFVAFRIVAGPLDAIAESEAASISREPGVFVALLASAGLLISAVFSARRRTLA